MISFRLSVQWLTCGQFHWHALIQRTGAFLKDTTPTVVTRTKHDAARIRYQLATPKQAPKALVGGWLGGLTQPTGSLVHFSLVQKGKKLLEQWTP